MKLKLVGKKHQLNQTDKYFLWFKTHFVENFLQYVNIHLQLFSIKLGQRYFLGNVYI